MVSALLVLCSGRKPGVEYTLLSHGKKKKMKIFLQSITWKEIPKLPQNKLSLNKIKWEGPGEDRGEPAGWGLWLAAEPGEAGSSKLQ